MLIGYGSPSPLCSSSSFIQLRTLIGNCGVEVLSTRQIFTSLAEKYELLTYGNVLLFLAYITQKHFSFFVLCVFHVKMLISLVRVLLEVQVPVLCANQAVAYRDIQYNKQQSAVSMQLAKRQEADALTIRMQPQLVVRFCYFLLNLIITFQAYQILLC